MYEDVGATQGNDSLDDFPPPPPPEQFEDPDDIYEECGDQVESKVPAQPPPPVSRPQPLEEPGDVYDDCASASPSEDKKEDSKGIGKSAEPPPLPSGNRRRDPPPVPVLPSDPPPPTPPKADLPAIPKSLPPPIPDRRPSNSEAAPPLPSNPPPVPGRGGNAPRVPQLRKPFMDRDEDFENIFYSKWNCTADSSKELTFKQGDMIHVLSQDFEAENWWVGELEGKIGLVPKEYLCPAFELVA